MLQPPSSVKKLECFGKQHVPFLKYNYARGHYKLYAPYVLTQLRFPIVADTIWCMACSNMPCLQYYTNTLFAFI
jgi:hypothetical protein